MTHPSNRHKHRVFFQLAAVLLVVVGLTGPTTTNRTAVTKL